MTTTDIKKFELIEMKKVLQLINTKGWDNIDFQLVIKNPGNIKIEKFKFKDCLGQNAIDAMRKVIKISFEKAIQRKEKEIE